MHGAISNTLEEKLGQLDQPNQPSRELVDALNNLARAITTTDLARAESLSKRAMQLANRLAYREGEARALTLLSWLNFLEGQADLALTRALNAEAVARLAQDPRLEGHALYMIAVIHDQVGNFAEAMKAHQKMIAIARELGDGSLEANGFLALGVQHSHQAEHKKALDCFLRALALYRKIDADADRQAMALNNVAEALTETGDVLRALDYAKKAQAACDLANTRTHTQILYTLGKVCAAMGQLDESLNHLSQALRIFAAEKQSGQIVDRELEATVQVDMAKVQRARNQHQHAFSTLQCALEIGQAIDAKPLLVQVHDQLSKTYRETGQIALALAHAEQRETVRASLRQITTERQDKVIRLMAILQASRNHVHQEQCQAAQDWLWRACLHGNAPVC